MDDDTAPAGPAHGGYGDDDPPEPDSAPLPRSIGAGDIREELDLAACGDIAALLVRRRQFARENHPDRVPADLRENATTRMMIANGLIDAEIRRRSD